MARKRTKARPKATKRRDYPVKPLPLRPPARVPAKPMPISVDEAAGAFDVPRAAIEIAQQLGELPRVLTLTALIKWTKRRDV